MGWNGLERNKLDYILTDLLPVELSELFSFRSFYDFLLEKEQQSILALLTKEYKTLMANGKQIMFKNGWATTPLKYNILKGTDSTREMSVIQPLSALNLFLFMECYQKDILNYFESKNCFSIRYHKKNTALHYKSRLNKATQYFQLQSKPARRSAIQQTGSYFRISPFESINSFPDSRPWRISNFKYRYYATMDYKSCFGSIYTHAYKWIIERNVIDSTAADNSNFFISIDRVLQNINGKSSNGLIVGPEFSRMIAEVLLQQIDSDVLLALSADGIKRNKDYTIYRYVDDIFVFTSTQEYLEKIIEKYKMLGEKYLLQLNELKLVRGETPCVPKGWLEKTRHISDVIDQIFYTGKRTDYDVLPDEDRFIVKSDYIPVDRIKSEITVIMKAYPENRRTIVSFLLSTLLNNISKRKDGYILFGDKKISNAMYFRVTRITPFRRFRKIYGYFASFEKNVGCIALDDYTFEYTAQKLQFSLVIN